jgi:hypothetical protein
MWYGFDRELQRELAVIRRLVALRHQTPTNEWPLIFIEEHDVMLVVREWPDGTITCYVTEEHPGTIRGNGHSRPR